MDTKVTQALHDAIRKERTNAEADRKAADERAQREADDRVKAARKLQAETTRRLAAELRAQTLACCMALALKPEQQNFLLRMLLNVLCSSWRWEHLTGPICDMNAKTPMNERTRSILRMHLAGQVSGWYPWHILEQYSCHDLCSDC